MDIQDPKSVGSKKAWVGGKDWAKYSPEMVLPPEIGYPAGRTDVPPEYLIKIDSWNNYENQKTSIRAVMQSEFSVRTTSDWVPFSGSLHAREWFARTFQAVTGLSFISKFSTRRVWVGTSPLALSIPLIFTAYENPRTEVLLPCRVLQEMVLPSGTGEEPGLKGAAMRLFTLSPPGPNPFYSITREKAAAYLGEHIGGWAKDIVSTGLGHIINISIGKMLFFPRVIIRDVTIKIPPKFTAGGYPIMAEADVQFETFEIMTKQDIRDVIYDPLLAGVSTPNQEVWAGTNDTPGITVPSQQGTMVA